MLNLHCSLRKARRFSAAGLCCFICFLKTTPALAASRPNHPNAWLSLGFSTLDEESINWSWLRTQLKNEDLLKRWNPPRNAAIIVPVFDGGRALFKSGISVFDASAPEAARDEASLNLFLKAAKRRGIKVFLGFDLLGWQKFEKVAWQNRASGPGPRFFDASPELEELSSALTSSDVNASFASPWSSRVRQMTATVITEAAKRFPDAAGAVLDLHLQRGEITGYSSSARLASKRDLQLDPIDLGIQGTADEQLSPNAKRWLAWRDASLESFARFEVEAWQKARGEVAGEIWLSGVANYESIPSFDTLRSGQNWENWLKDLPVTGAIVEGHWSTGDALKWSQISNLAQITGKQIVPMFISKISGRDLREEWAVLGAHNKAQNGVVFIDTPMGISTTMDWMSGKYSHYIEDPLKIDTVLPEVELVTIQGDLWSPRAIRGKEGMVVLEISNIKSQQEQKAWIRQTQQFAEKARSIKLSGYEPVIVMSPSIPIPTFPNVESPPVILMDSTGRWLSHVQADAAVTIVDSAGFVRSNKPLLPENDLNQLIPPQTGTTEAIRVGTLAPDFIMTDMNGQTRQISSLRGKKALLFSFFPKCFTGGCTNHMASLSSFYDLFEKNGIDVLGVSIDPADVQRDFAERWKLRFALVPDTGRQLCFLYDAISDVNALANRQTIFIDKEGVVRFIDRDVNVLTHGSDIVERLKKAGYIKAE